MSRVGGDRLIMIFLILDYRRRSTFHLNDIGSELIIRYTLQPPLAVKVGWPCREFAWVQDGKGCMSLRKSRGHGITDILTSLDRPYAIDAL
jgi:hypothetical protein